jgi:hypothetical protein
MKNKEHNEVQQMHNNTNTEYADELSLNQQAMETLVETKAGGMITRKLVEMGQRQLLEESKEKK